MKKILIVVLCLMLVLSAFTACGKTEENKPGADKLEKISVVATIFPEYDWVKQVSSGVDSLDVKLLLDKGVDLHSYQPTADDIIRISECDLFIYVGGESDEWVEDVLENAKNKDMKVINLLEALGDSVKEEELVEGMEGEEEEEEGEEGEEEEAEYDEHVWLSLKNAREISKVIASALSEINPENREVYGKNLDAYCAKLDELDRKYEDAVKDGSRDTVLFADRFPFRYLVDDYGLNYYAAFVGCSAESEASFETILFLAKKTDELGLKTILQIESADGRIADTVKNATTGKDQKILTMDSMQSATMNDVNSGVTYLSIMEKNLEVLKEALK